MSQQIFSADEVAAVRASREPMNVAENWTLFDTVLIGVDVSRLDYHTGWFQNFAALGAAATIPFFNVRNKNHYPYNNQDVRDQMPYAFEIYSLGVSIWAPSSTTYYAVSPVIGAQTTSNHLFETEFPKHCSLILQTNQDERVKLVTLMAPSGYGVVSGGVGQGDCETAWTCPPISLASFTQGVPTFTNHWGFVNPLRVPRTTNLSVVLRPSEYMRAMLTALPGPLYQPMRSVANDGTWAECAGYAGIQVTLGGRRLVQQRGEEHA